MLAAGITVVVTVSITLAITEANVTAGTTAGSIRDEQIGRMKYAQEIHKTNAPEVVLCATLNAQRQYNLPSRAVPSKREGEHLNQRPLVAALNVNATFRGFAASNEMCVDGWRVHE